MSSSNESLPSTLVTFKMVCSGLSQNTQNFQLQSYRDKIIGKPYHEICDNIAVKMIYEPWSIYRSDQMVFKNGKMDIPHTPIPVYLSMNQISLDSEMIQTLVEHCRITHVDIKR